MDPGGERFDCYSYRLTRYALNVIDRRIPSIMLSRIKAIKACFGIWVIGGQCVPHAIAGKPRLLMADTETGKDK